MIYACHWLLATGNKGTTRRNFRFIFIILENCVPAAYPLEQQQQRRGLRRATNGKELQKLFERTMEHTSMCEHFAKREAFVCAKYSLCLARSQWYRETNRMLIAMVFTKQQNEMFNLVFQIFCEFVRAKSVRWIDTSRQARTGEENNNNNNHIEINCHSMEYVHELTIL